MEYRLLGRSGLKVSALTVGTATFGHTGVWGTTEANEARRQIDLCLDHGVNLLDTANMYGGSRSEQISGEVLAENGRRQRMMVATKVRFPMGSGPNEQGLSRFHIIEQCEASLRRLKSDVIDLYQVHQWDGSTPLEETMEALNTLITQGKVRYIGCSNHPAWKVVDADWIAQTRGLNGFISCQDHYSLLRREIEAELIPAMRAKGLGLLPFFPLANGLLTGKYKRGESAPEGTRLSKPGFAKMVVNDANFDRVEALDAYAVSRGHTLLELAFSWLLAQPVVSSVIAGATKPAQILANAQAGEWVLTAEEESAVRSIVDPAKVA